jgi:hypothetical protein
LNWSYEMLSVLDEQGALSPEVVTATGALAQALFALDGDWTVEYRETGAIEALSEKGVRNDPRWEAIRVLARQALAEFKALGVPIPGLLDEEYNARRTDAP